jgi:hypothetical protein
MKKFFIWTNFPWTFGDFHCIWTYNYSGRVLIFLPSSAQAQAQLEAALALFSFDPAPNPPVKVYFAVNLHPVVTKLQGYAYWEDSSYLLYVPKISLSLAQLSPAC